MPSSKLRKRRGLSENADEVLPLHNGSKRSGARFRRRKKRLSRSFGDYLSTIGICLSVSLLCLFGLARLMIVSTKEADSPHPSLVHRVKTFRGNLAGFSKRKRIKEPNTFACGDGSYGILNDNYCDCPDGTDETETSACSHILIQKQVFACQDGSGYIFPSRVGDGVKDCPDGSDEL